MSSIQPFARVEVVSDGSAVHRIAKDVIYIADDLALRNQLHERGAKAVFTSTTPSAAALIRTLSVPNGTVWLDDALLETPEGRRRLSGRHVRLLDGLADGGWHDDDHVRSWLGGAESLSGAALHSVVARLRTTLGPCLERGYGQGWRLVPSGERTPSPDLIALLQTDRSTPSGALCSALGCRPAALRVRIHRLRRAGHPIVTTSDGYMLDDDDGVSFRLGQALLLHPLVVLWGPIGVGTSWLAAQQRRRLVSVEGMDEDRASRRLQQLALGAPGSVWVDGATDPAPLLGPLMRLVGVGFRVLVTARRPLPPAPGLANVERSPWAIKRLQRVFPGQDVSSWEGLPFSMLSAPERRERLLRSVHGVDPALVEEVGTGEHLQGAALQLAVRQGWCVAEGRVAAPVLEALRVDWGADRWIARGQTLAARWSNHLHHGLGRDLDGGEALGVVHELQRRDLPSHDLVSPLFHKRVLRDETMLLHAQARCPPGDQRASLLYSRWLLCPLGEDDLLRQAVVEAHTEAITHEMQVELAYSTWFARNDESRAWFADTRRWLDQQPPDAHLWIRSEWLVSLALRDPHAVEPDDVLDLFLRIQRMQLLHDVAKGNSALIQLRWALGVTSMARDALSAARRALEPVVKLLGSDAVWHGAMDLLLVYVRQGDFEAADALWPLIRDADLNLAWHERRQMTLGLWQLAQGHCAAAAFTAHGFADVEGRSVLLGLLRAFQGEALASGPRPDVNAAVVAVVRGEAPPESLSVLPSCRFLSGGFVHSLLITGAQAA